MDVQGVGVLVGVDGSACADRAVGWAAAEAEARRTRLTVAYVVDLPRLADVPLSPDLVATVQRDGRSVLDAAVARALQAHPGLEVTGTVLDGNPATELLRLAEDAEQAVVGSRGSGGFARLLLGSVGGQVAAHAHCPVVVVRGRPDAAGTVVVGLDGSDRSEAALEYAFGYAERHGVPLEALHLYALGAFVYPVMPYPVPAYPVTDELERIRAEAARETGQAVERWSAKFPDVPVSCVVQEGAAAYGLVEASRDAGLLVVGCRGHGGFAGMVLGSVSQAAVRHAHCPVAVVHRPGR